MPSLSAMRTKSAKDRAAIFFMTCSRWIFSRAAERRCHLLRRHPRKQGLAPATWQRLASRPGSQLIDVRTRAEWTYVAIPDLGPIGERAVLVEWQTFPDQTVDPRFVERLAGELKALGAQLDDDLFFICRSGGRSLAAAKAMAEADYRACGWR
jgi:rhodanese-related sulfurtransferase